MKKRAPIQPSAPEFAAACRAALEEILSKGAIAVVIVYETPTALGHASVPKSSAVALGLLSLEHARLSE